MTGLPSQELPPGCQCTKTSCYFSVLEITERLKLTSSLWPVSVLLLSLVSVNLLFCLCGMRSLSGTAKSPPVQSCASKSSPALRQFTSGHFSLECRQQSRSFLRGPGAGEENPGEHPSSRPQASHRGPPYHLELYTGLHQTKTSPNVPWSNMFWLFFGITDKHGVTWLLTAVHGLSFLELLFTTTRLQYKSVSSKLSPAWEVSVQLARRRGQVPARLRGSMQRRSYLVTRERGSWPRCRDMQLQRILDWGE